MKHIKVLEMLTMNHTKVLEMLESGASKAEILEMLELENAKREATREERLRMIEQGLETEHYEEWAEDDSIAVRSAIARQGYMHDLLIHDESSYVRYDVMKADPSYMAYHKDSPSEKENIWKVMRDMVTVDLDVIEAQIKLAESQNESRPHLKTKYAALSREMTLLERTTNRVDLYLSGNPMWARDLTFGAVNKVLYHAGVWSEPTRDYIEHVFATYAQP